MNEETKLILDLIAAADARAQTALMVLENLIVLLVKNGILTKEQATSLGVDTTTKERL